MSETTILRPKAGPKTPARPVSIFTIVFLFVVFAAFAFLVRHFYHATTAAPQVAAPENITKDLAWKASRETRRAALSQMRAEQNQELATYGWIDQKAGVVRLPIERAMELTAQKYGPHQH